MSDSNPDLEVAEKVYYAYKFFQDYTLQDVLRFPEGSKNNDWQVIVSAFGGRRPFEFLPRSTVFGLYKLCISV